MRGPKSNGNGSNGHGETDSAVLPVLPEKGGRKALKDAIQEADQKSGGKHLGKRIPKPEAGAKAGKMEAIDVKALMIQPAVMTLTVKGLTPLLVHNFGAKAIGMILDKQMGKAKAGPRAHKDPFEEFKESLYVIDRSKLPKRRLEIGEAWGPMKGVFGFPASAFKKALVTACSFVQGVKKTWIRGLVHVHGDLLPITYAKLYNRQDTVRVGPFGKRSADIRFRGEFHDWSVQLRISYNRSAISPEQIAMLINNAGFSVGVGEWRPEKDGSSGTFAIE